MSVHIILNFIFLKLVKAKISNLSRITLWAAPKVNDLPVSVGVPTSDEHSLLSPVYRRPDRPATENIYTNHNRSRKMRTNLDQQLRTVTVQELEHP